jgi:DNA polymerase-3 subunit gamma/tau
MPVLTRAWQMLLKGIEEVQTAPLPGQAAEMVLIRLAYVADLPVPAELVRDLTKHDSAPAAAVAAPSSASGERVVARGQTAEAAPVTSPSHAFGSGPTLARNAGEGLAPVSIRAAAMPAIAAAPLETQGSPAPALEYDPAPQSFAEVIALFDKRREALIRSHLWSHAHLVTFEPGRIELRPEETAPRDLANRLGQLLTEWTGMRWVVAVSRAAGAPTPAEQAAQHESAVRNEVVAHPLVRAVLDTFPGATIAAVRERAGVIDAAGAAPEANDDATAEASDAADEASAGEDDL